MAVQRIYGVEILNSGAGLSVDDIVNEQQCTFVARTLSQWVPVEISASNTLDQLSFYDRVSELTRQQTGTGAAVTMEQLTPTG